jgi:hypothetical protein
MVMTHAHTSPVPLPLPLFASPCSTPPRCHATLQPRPTARQTPETKQTPELMSLSPNARTPKLKLKATVPPSPAAPPYRARVK